MPYGAGVRNSRLMRLHDIQFSGHGWEASRPERRESKQRRPAEFIITKTTMSLAEGTN